MKIRYGNVLPEEAANVLGTMESTSGLVPQLFKTMQNNTHIRHGTAFLNGNVSWRSNSWGIRRGGAALVLTCSNAFFKTAVA